MSTRPGQVGKAGPTYQGRKCQAATQQKESFKPLEKQVSHKTHLRTGNMCHAPRLCSFDLLASGPPGGRCLANAAGLRNALVCLFHSLVEDREFLLRGGPGSHCPIKLRVAHIELR